MHGDEEEHEENDACNLDNNDAVGGGAKKVESNTCSCLQCPVVTREEEKCCSDIPSLKVKLDADKVLCVLDQPSFLNIFNRDNHILYMNIMNDIFRDDSSEFPLNTRLRYSAYRTSISFIYGRLGRKKRTQLPSCIVEIVRKMYPSENGEYVDFKAAVPELGS